MPGFWRKCRIAFRCVRFAVWLMLLAVLVAFLWCNRIGLPDFLTTRLTGTLLERGVKLEFSRMRLSLVHGLVAENVRAGQTNNADSPAFAAREVQLQLDFPALFHQRWQLDGLVLRAGQFILPLSPTNALTLTNLQADLRFQTDDTWSLDHFRANFADTQIGITGEIAHAPEARNWKFFSSHDTDRGAAIASLKKFSDALPQIHFQGEPQIRLTLSGDARNVHSIIVRLDANASGVNTPWFAAQNFRANASLAAPTNSASDWRSASEPSLRFRGDVTCVNAIVRGVKLDAARARFSYADLLWDLTELTVAQGRTHLRLSGQESEATKNFRCLLTGQLDESSIGALLTTSNAIHGLSQLTCREPLALTLDVGGNLRRLETLRASGHIALTNFAIRGQTVDSVAAKLFYTNSVLEFYSPQLWRAGGTQWLKADAVRVDFKRQAIYFTNGWSLAEPQVVARAIGPKTGLMLEPYHFLTPPLAHVHGSAPIVNVNNGLDAQDADLTFEIMRGVPFRWARLQTTNLTGTIHWLHQTLTLTNIVADLYAGHGEGSGYLDLSPVTHDCDYNFLFAITNVDLHLLAADLTTNKNNLAGQLSGAVTVTNASSEDWHSWNGGGHARLRQGVLWDVPVFAFVSPLLNRVSPGLGNNRASEATATFIITNGVITTDSLLIRADMMRLQYAGTVDLMQKVDAKVTAQLLRNTPVVGSVVSLLLAPVGKIFECHVTGELGEPIVTPIYIPKILLAPLHPVRSLEELFAPSPATNAPVGK